MAAAYCQNGPRHSGDLGLRIRTGDRLTAGGGACEPGLSPRELKEASQAVRILPNGRTDFTRFAKVTDLQCFQ